MTLTIQKQEDEQRQLAVTVQVAEERVRKAMRQEARTIAKRTRVPGFRPGKAPYNVVIGLVGGEEALRQDVINDMVDAVFQEALIELDVTPFAQPTLKDLDYESATIKLVIPLEPVVELGDYRVIRREVEQPSVSDEAIEEALEHVRSHHAVVEPVDRPIELEDEVTISGQGFLADNEEDKIFDEESFEFTVEADSVFRGTPFVQELLGLTAGDEHSFSFTFEEGYEVEAWAGKEATFNVTVLDVKSRTLPPLDDELAKMEGDYETLEALRESLAKDLENQANDQFRTDTRESWINDLVDGVETLVYPPGAIETELDSLVENYRNQFQMMGIDWDEFLSGQGRTEADQREEMEDAAVESLERRLALQKFIEMEKLTIEPQEMEAGVDKYLARYGDNEDLKSGMRSYLMGQGSAMIMNDIMLDKVHDRILLILAGEAPDLTEEEVDVDADEEAASDGSNDAPELVAEVATAAEDEAAVVVEDAE